MLARMASSLCISGNLPGRIISNLEENLMFTFGILFYVLFRRERSKRDTKVSETGLQAGAQACSVVSSCFDESLSLTLHLTSDYCSAADCWAWMETTPRPQLQTSCYSYSTSVRPFIQLAVRSRSCEYIPHPTLSLPHPHPLATDFTVTVNMEFRLPVANKQAICFRVNWSLETGLLLH